MLYNNTGIEYFGPIEHEVSGYNKWCTEEVVMVGALDSSLV